MADPLDPLTPPDCDLRDFPHMQLDVLRLRDSGAAALANPEAFRACVLAWCISWHQVPAASLPDDDNALSILLGYGRTVAVWKEIRASGGLHGWVKCSDGRLYHPVVAEKALAAWSRKQSQRERSRKGNAIRWGSKTDPSGMADGSHQDAEQVQKGSQEGHVTDPSGIVQRSLEDRKGEREGEGEERNPYSPLFAADLAPPEASPTRKAEPRGNRLPADWQPSQDDAAFATSLHLDPIRVAAEFRDYWHGVPGAKGRKLDWSATFRNRCRDRAGRTSPTPATAPRQPGKSYAGCM